MQECNTCQKKLGDEFFGLTEKGIKRHVCISCYEQLLKKRSGAYRAWAEKTGRKK